MKSLWKWLKNRICCSFCLKNAKSEEKHSKSHKNQHFQLLIEYINSDTFSPRITNSFGQFCSIKIQLAIQPEASCTKITMITDFENQVENLGILHTLQSPFIIHPLSVQTVVDHCNDRDEYLLQIITKPIIVCSLDWLIEAAKAQGIPSLPNPVIKSVLLSLIQAFRYVHSSNGFIVK